MTHKHEEVLEDSKLALTNDDDPKKVIHTQLKAKNIDMIDESEMIL